MRRLPVQGAKDRIYTMLRRVVHINGGGPVPSHVYRRTWRPWSLRRATWPY